MLRRLSVLALASLFTSCAAGISVVKSASPNPFTGTREFRLQALDFEHLSVNGAEEKDHLAQLDEQEVATWNRNKAEMQTAFVLALREQVASAKIDLANTGTYSIKPYITQLETDGKLELLSARLIVEIRDADGAIVEQVEAEPWVPSALILGADERVRIVANRMGRWVGGYLRSRVGD